MAKLTATQVQVLDYIAEYGGKVTEWQLKQETTANYKTFTKLVSLELIEPCLVDSFRGYRLIEGYVQSEQPVPVEPVQEATPKTLQAVNLILHETLDEFDKERIGLTEWPESQPRFDYDDPIGPEPVDPDKAAFTDKLKDLLSKGERVFGTDESGKIKLSPIAAKIANDKAIYEAGEADAQATIAWFDSRLETVKTRDLNLHDRVIVGEGITGTVIKVEQLPHQSGKPYVAVTIRRNNKIQTTDTYTFNEVFVNEVKRFKD